ncbi:CotS family spore coat protein [Neobacillus thermocopriae]|uniref:CotS family spore coat protein n=1 Tax=Neobacillus thermocopriae TaxID=1215031 RepID=A0A6B3TRQ4_9BACI|nr:CotS family spore coat protein [Neobacillus thermocopriae]MED3623796.1 CotS family spore coat protein [Neobacillus thermocopriae]MED3712995.1 CotS family spore coat protein [Neobacillus thermocopriae]NEX79070.1 CotS family spore coat protein [Neobacillus thermocopriae]
MDETMRDLELGKQLMAENYPHLQLTNIEIIQGGGIKTVWKVETTEGTFCLKRIRKSLPIVKFTTSAQAYLSSKGALVAAIIPTKDNNLYFVHEGYALVLYSWIEGTDLDMEKNQEHLEIGLKGLAQFHKDTVGFVPPSDCETYNRMGVWPDNFKKMLEEFKQWKLVSEQLNTPFHQTYLNIADEIIEMAEKSVQLLDRSCYHEWVKEIGEYGYMCHQDYGKGNALQTEKGVYVLDLDNLAYDIPLRDVRKLIFKRMAELESWDLNLVEHLINCYASVFPLTEDQRKIIYIDLLFPHKFYGYVKKPFKKGKDGEIRKLLKTFKVEEDKMPVLRKLLQLD